MILNIHVVPNSSNNQIVGWVGSDNCREIKIKIAAPPEDGKANKALIKFLSKRWRIAKSDIEITGGFTSRHKKLQINSEITEDFIC
ncbi:MAG: DUF167 domain-containing protein [Rickettsiales bacterium]